MEKILIIASLIVLITIASGFYLVEKGVSANRKKLKRVMRVNLFAFVPTIAFALITVVPQAVAAAPQAASTGNGLGFMGAALSTGLAALGAGIAVGSVGSSAIGAVSEDPSFLGKTLIFIGLAEGIAIYGLIISIMILGRI